MHGRHPQGGRATSEATGPADKENAMASITLTATVTEDRHLELDLPEDVPIGPVELTIKPLVSLPEAETNPRREELRAKFIAAGLMSPEPYADPDTVPLSDDELDQIGRLFAGSRLMSDLIDEDRGPR
jgi:hypothetical protein